MCNSMKISPHFRVEDWKKLDLTNEKDWLIAIEIFEDRIRGSFLGLLEGIESKEYAGFVVMALDCLLIEALQQFFRGEERIPEGNLRRYYIDFLTQSTFSKYFSRYMAILFYEHIRCGIFHHGIILGDSKICAGRDVPLANLTESDSGLIINHVFFHWQLAEEFNEYLVRLKDPGEIELRENFERKMDYICGII